MNYSDSHPHQSEQSADGVLQTENCHSTDVYLKCSLCGKRYKKAHSRHRPFCSARCQQIDLGNWLDERYGFPVEGREDALPADDDSDEVL